MVKEIFLNKLNEYGIDTIDVLKGGLLLLATCIPLHYDDKDRQQRIMEKIERHHHEN